MNTQLFQVTAGLVLAGTIAGCQASAQDQPVLDIYRGYSPETHQVAVVFDRHEMDSLLPALPSLNKAKFNTPGNRTDDDLATLDDVERRHRQATKAKLTGDAGNAENGAEPGAEGGTDDKWSAAAGSTLKRTVTAWGDEAGWKILWKPDLDYPIKAEISFDGSFEEAITQIFNLYSSAGRSFSVNGSRRQKVLLVQEKER